MADYIYSIVLLIITLSAIELRKSYYLVPKSELRFRARNGDALAAKLYRALSFEESLDIFLWLVIILSASGSLILFNQVAPLWLDFIAIALLIWLAFAWLPKTPVNRFGTKIASLSSPLVIWILNLIHPLIQKIPQGSKTKSKSTAHSGLYDKSDLTRLISSQKKQSDNRIEITDLELTLKALKLADKAVGAYATSWSKIHHISAGDAVGPVLLDELHKSNQLFVPVVEAEDKKTVVGMIDTGRLDISSSGEVRDLMNKNIAYLNEDDSLDDALRTAASSGRSVFIVLDKKQRLQGMVSLITLIDELITPRTKNEKEDKKDQPEPEVKDNNPKTDAES